MAQIQTKTIENSGITSLGSSAVYSAQANTNGTTSVDIDISALGFANPPVILSHALVIPVADGGSVAAMASTLAVGVAVSADRTKIRFVLSAASAGSKLNILFQEG